MKLYKHIDTITAFFVITLIASNLLSSAKLVDAQLSLFGTPFVFDGGLLIFPFCYIFSDMLTEVYGYKRSRKVIWLGFFSLVFVSVLLKVLSLLPGEASWLSSGGEQSFDLILSGLYNGGLILASISAYLVGEFTNSWSLAKLKVFQKGEHMALRFVASTLLGQLLDTGIFFLITCSLGVFPTELFASLVLTNYSIKVLIEVLFLPISLRVVRAMKKAENEDYYDYKTNFNPFIFSR